MSHGSKPSVYLAGPITGLTYEEGSNGWRQEATNSLSLYGIECFSPLRGHGHLNSIGKIEKQYFDMSPLTTPRGILDSDHYDVINRDMILANLMNSDRVSVGTVMEIAWGYAYRKPIVAIMDKENIHYHAMLIECCSFIVEKVDEAVAICKRVLLSGGAG